jgi:dipeptidase E
MKNIILAGGGNKEQSLIVDKFFLSKIDNNKHLLYIPLAMNPEKHPFSGCLNWIKSIFSPLGFEDIDMWTDLHDKKYEDLLEYNAIYIGGGNTFRLLSIIKSSGFFSTLKKFIENGGLIYGGSAGAVILGQNISTSSDENKVDLKDIKGLDVLSKYAIKCHYNSDMYNFMDKLAKDSNMPIIAIPEDAGLFFDGNVFIVIYAGSPVTVFSSKIVQEYKTAQVITL